MCVCVVCIFCQTAAVYLYLHIINNDVIKSVMYNFPVALIYLWASSCDIALLEDGGAKYYHISSNNTTPEQFDTCYMHKFSMR